MIVVALIVALAAVIVVSLGTTGVIRSLVRQQARERDKLQDKLMHLAGRTWTSPPAAEPPPETFDDYGLIDPSQLPDPQ